MSRVRLIELRLVAIPLVRPFRTSMGVESDKECVLVRVETDESEGWGECVAGSDPGYSSEFNESAWAVLRDHLGPSLLGAGGAGAEDAERAMAWVRGHRMAKAALLMAVLDAELRADSVSLASRLGAVRDRVECGVSIGITDTSEQLLEQVEGYLAEGYRRVKLKIEPGLDVDRVAAVRGRWPEVALSVDANAAYRPEDADRLRELDRFGLLMIEQPLAHDDLYRHSLLAAKIETPICLDESIRSAAEARAAVELGACGIVNIKQGRVGGLLEAVRTHDVCRELGVPVWCGGMLETGLGRAANLALAALPGFTLPGDTSASSRYFEDDLTEPFLMAPDGTMAVPRGPGLGVRPLPGRLAACTRRIERVAKKE